MSIENSTPKTRLDWIDRTKGLAILGIVLFHFFQNYPDRTHVVLLFDKMGAKVGLAAVDLFFVIAGFNISYSIGKSSQFEPPFKHWKAWFLKRIYRLYPTYILAVCCSLVLYKIWDHSVQYFSLKFFLSFIGFGGYLLQEINPGFWFFTVILQAYLLTPWLYRFCQANRRTLLLVGLGAGVFTKSLCFYLEPGSSTYLYFLNNNFLGSYIFQLCLGFYWGSIYQSRQTLRRVDCWASLVCFVLGALVYTGLTLGKTDIVYMQGFDILFTPFLFILCGWGFNLASTFKPIAPILKIFSLLGVYSYQIYLLHQPMFFISLTRIARVFNFSANLEIFGSLLIVCSLLTLYILAFILLEQALIKPKFIFPVGDRRS